MEIKDRLFADINEGEIVEDSKEVSEEAVNAFATLTGDYNPLHVDAVYAKDTSFGKNVAHGMLLTSWFSALAGMQLPGTRSLILQTSFKYNKPVFIGETILLRLTVRRKVEAVMALDCACEIFVDGDKRVDGSMLVQVR